MIYQLRMVLTVASFAWLNAWARDLSNTDLSSVEARLADGAKASWELGTRSQALLELNANIFSVLTPQPLPPPPTIPANLTDQMSTILGIAKSVVSNRGASNGPKPLMNEGSAADPASLGMVVLLANWTGQGRSDGLDYAGAATDQLDYLLEDVPKTSDGAISHRTEQVQLWSDYVYMVPPFLAYYGVLSSNQTLVSEAYNQISLYRSYLLDRRTNHLWHHIVLGTLSSGAPNDLGHWATGNAWAAAGMLRVLGTIQNSQYAQSMNNEQRDLANWVKEIHTGVYAFLDSDGLFKNYPDEDLSENNFYDASSTALMASTVYRLALMSDSHAYLSYAERSRIRLSSDSGSSNLKARLVATSNSNDLKLRPRPSPIINCTTSAPTRVSVTMSPTYTTPSLRIREPPSPLQHFTTDGWLTPVVNPYQFSAQGSQSPEGQAFVLEMYAAWRDWVAAGSPGANGCMQSIRVNWMSGLIILVGVVLQWIY